MGNDHYTVGTPNPLILWEWGLDCKHYGPCNLKAGLFNLSLFLLEYMLLR